MSKGLFITVEGIDGAGKSTQIPLIAEAIRSHSIDLVQTREPGGTPLGEKIRGLLLSDDMTSKCEMLLMFAARQENTAKVIRPALEEGKWVLCDRYTDASYAYQAGGRQEPEEYIRTLENFVHPDLKPDKTILFDLPAEVAAQRMRRAQDRIEKMQSDFHVRVRNKYLELARREPERFVVIDSSQAPEKITEYLKKLIASWIGKN